ncbi:MAG: polysaccharide deacetylase family protein [Chitinophagaceae bacterium]|nr:polysaccharide deacetylase family protein [Chitinophagaceae bacterium]
MNIKYLITGCLALAAMTACNNNADKKAAADSTKAQASNGPGSVMKLDSSKRYIYLTWDDSPQPPGTINCKRVFHEEGVKATFFSVGFNVVGPLKKRLVDSLRKAYPEFLLANHSFSHGFRNQYGKFYSASMTDSALHDFLKNQEMLEVPVKIIRMPGNNTWAANGKITGQKANNGVVKALDSLGYKIIGWDLEWHEKGKFPQESVAEIVKQINQKFEDGNTVEQNALVILSHDRLFEKPQYVDSLRKLIQTLKADKRNAFETIDHYPMVMRK